MKRTTIFDSLCETTALLKAAKHVRENGGAAGVDQVTIAEYWRDLMGNLRDLGRRLREGGYYPMPLRRFELQKADGRVRQLGIFTVEDRIAQRAAFNLLEPLWEPSFLECSYGFRPVRNAEMAVKRVLEYRAAGENYVVDADIADCFSSLDHELVMNLVRLRVRDNRMLSLIRMWLAAGQALPSSNDGQASEASLLDRLTDFASCAVNDVMTQMMDQPGYGAGYSGAYQQPFDAPFDPADETRPADDAAAELRRAARREAYKRLGRDAFLLGLTYLGRKRRLLSPATLALTGAAALATAAYPAASRLIRERWNSRNAGAGAVQGSALSPLLANIVLHEFDLALTGAGLHLVRYADDWVVTCRDAESAERALRFADRKLAELRLRVNPEKTRIITFEQGLVFLGYKFDPFQLTATPAPTATQGPIRMLWREAPAAFGELKERVAPKVARFGKQAAEGVKSRAERLTRLFKRRGERKDSREGDDDHG